ncbi:glycosyltransferase family 4 protein [Paenibacillus sp. BR2-3]|uniref:glycosyltransferase family 4 protein n=1 Tax=Paenibacillus sp. BR2-3 TaxID=3048494 RepID=UPI003977AC70
MKLLFTFFVPGGGVETLNRLRCLELRKYGIEGHLLFLNKGSGQTNFGSIPVYTTPYEEDLLQLIQIHKYDAVIVTSDFTMPEKLRRLSFGGPIVFETQGFGIREEAIRLLSEGSAQLQAHCTAAVMPPTSHLIELMLGLVPELPRFVFQNPLDTSAFTYIPGNRPPKPVVAWVGRLENNKNWKLFLEIGYWMVKHRPQVELWMFVDYELSAEAEKNEFWLWVNHLGIQDQIKLLPNVPHFQMPAYYSLIGDSGGLLLSTSYLEGYGYAVAEAIACRCPVLSTDSDGVRNFIIHNQTGKFFPQGDVNQGVAEAMNLMDDQVLREHIRTGGVNYVTDLMAPEKYALSFRNMMNALGVY